MIRKIIALCLVLMAVSFVFSGCKDKEDPVKPDTPGTEGTDGHDHDDDDGHNH